MTQVSLTSIASDHECPNLGCENKLGEGTFCVLRIVVDGKKPVTLLMCRPCGEVIQKTLDGVVIRG